MIKLYMDVKFTLQASKNGPVFQHLKSLFPFVHVYRQTLPIAFGFAFNHVMDETNFGSVCKFVLRIWARKIYLCPHE